MWRFNDSQSLRTSPDTSKFNVLVTTYETLLADIEHLSTFRWRVMITDEGHRLKSPTSKISRALREGLEVEHNLLLTGTPIQNNTHELWALMSFVQKPERFMSFDDFTDRFGDMRTSAQVSELRQLMRPIVLRRLKREVAKSIPAMKETVIDVELTTLQKQYYRAIFEKNREYLYRGCSGNVPQLINVEMELRKCCQHPFLLSGVEDAEIERVRDAISAGEKTGTLDDLMLAEAARQDREAARLAKQQKGKEGVEDSDSDDDGASLLLPGARSRKRYRKEEKILPEGWTTEIMEKKSGKTKGSKYTYYYDPSGRRFRSMREIERYLGAELPVKVTEVFRHPAKRTKVKQAGDVSTGAAAAVASNATSSASSSAVMVATDADESSSSSATPAAADPLVAVEAATAAAVAEALAAKPAVVEETIDPSFYDTFEGDWCRYCGARDTSGWSRGPWGNRKLCIIHYVRWWQKKTLDLSPWEDKEPTRPIDLSKNTEWKYRQLKLIRERMVAKSSKDQQKSIMHKRKKKRKVDQVKQALSMQGCEIVLRKIAAHRFSEPFLEPVDQGEYSDYHSIIRKPMDLSTVWRKLKGFRGAKPYAGNKKKFARDMRLTFRNCLVYNDESSEICKWANTLARLFETLYSVWVEETSRTYFDDVLQKLPGIPGQWLDIGLDDDRENEDDISDAEEAALVRARRLRDNPENRIKKLRTQLQRDRGLQHRTLALQDRLSWDTEMFATEQQVKEIQQLPEVSKRIEALQARIDHEIEIVDELVERAMLQRIVDASGKLVLVDKLLPKLRNEGRRVLIFSQFKLVLDVLVRYLVGRGYPYERIDGGVHGNERQASIDRFCDPSSDAFIFLLSTKAGGVGINLTAADTVIIYDSDWNPQNDLQATARCHRIGQTKEVTTYRLVTRNTYEGEMFARASRKLGLERAVMSGSATGNTSLFSDAAGNMSASTGASGGMDDVLASKMTGEELEKLLKQGAYAVLGDNTEEESARYFEQDIETLLKTSAREIVHNPEGLQSAQQEANRLADAAAAHGETGDASSSSSSTSSSSASKGGVSMQSFAAAGADTGLNVDDADFWSKLMPGMQSARGLMSRLNDGAATKTAESKVQFMEQLTSVVSEILEAKRSGEDVSPHEWDTTKNMVLQVSCMKSHFHAEDVSRAAGWLMDIEGFDGRRSRSARASIVSEFRGSSRSQRRGDEPVGDGGDDDNSDDDENEDDDYAYDERTGKWERRRGKRGRKRGRYGRDKRSQYKKKKRISESVYADFCCLCEDGGELIVCDGPCLRTFHPQCLGLDSVPEGDTWECSDCLEKKHLCLICGKVGNDTPANRFPIAGENDVFLCSMHSCGRYYHKKCLESRPAGEVLFYGQSMDEAQSSSSSSSLAKTKFRCPQHFCHVCHNEVGSMLLKCNRCANAVHMCCVDKSKCQRISKQHIVCADHCPEGVRYHWKQKNNNRSELWLPDESSSSESDEEPEVEIDMDLYNQANPPKRVRTEDLPKLYDDFDPEWELGKEGCATPDCCALCRKAFVEVDPAANSVVEGPMIAKPFRLIPKGKGKGGGGKRSVEVKLLWVHENCAAYSPEVFQDEEGRWCNVLDAVKRSRGTRCAACNKSGATIGCIFGKCKDSFHLGCAHASGWTFASGDSTLICSKHRLDYAAPGGRDTWCLCKTPEDTGGFWMCCDTCENWFHPRCVSMPNNLAKSLLSYQCPLCRESEGGVPLGAEDTGFPDGLAPEIEVVEEEDGEGTGEERVSGSGENEGTGLSKTAVAL